jgi:hypothetical protein
VVVVERRLSRAQFVSRGALAAGGAAAFGLLDPLAAFGRAAGSPSPIPGGISFASGGPVTANPDIHVLAPGLIPDVALDVSTITDFRGAIAGAEIDGGAHGGDGTPYLFDADMRVMQGVYVDTAGRLRKGAFGFI